MTPGELRRVAFGFREARALFAGVELGLFAALGAGPRHAAELVDELELDPRGLAVLLDALVALGVLARDGARHALPPELRPLLVPGGPAYLGNLFEHDLWHWSTWARLDRAVREGTSQVTTRHDPHLGDPRVLRRFLPNYVAAMRQSAGDSLARVARRVLATAPRRVLDLGAGGGELAHALLEGSSSVEITLVDHAFALEHVAESVARSPRATLLPCDFEKVPLPGTFDAVVLSRVLMGFAPERARAVVASAASALQPGGRLFVHDFDRGSRVGALLGLDMLLNSAGEVHASEAIEAWLAASGLALESREPVLPYTRLWVARRP